MKIGVLARTNSRGLDIQTTEAARNLDASVLVVDVRNASGRHFPSDRSRFPDAPVVECRSGWRLDERTVRNWLDGLDVVYSAETFYDEHLPEWADSQGVKTVIHANPEFVPHGGGWAIGNPSAWWSPTCWRNDRLPQPTEVVPFPVAIDRFTPVQIHDGAPKWLHVAGKRALADRNGTDVLLEAIPLLKRSCSITIRTQDPDHIRVRTEWHVHVHVQRTVGNYWELYDGHDALVMPRRYGGLCLPVQEAMAAGMAVLMPDVSPNADTWPVTTFPTTSHRYENMPAGPVEIADMDPADLAAAMDELADPTTRILTQEQSIAWADAHSWKAQTPLWLDRFAAL